ncbi:MAG: c-type cytochrome [Rhodomicrobiaceae bacterium]
MNHSSMGIFIVGLAFALQPAIASGQERGDPEKGLTFAQEVCADCHGVRKGYEPSQEPFAPTFEAIANSPGMSELALSVFLRTPHATMPNLVLTETEIVDVVSYIVSLKK